MIPSDGATSLPLYDAAVAISLRTGAPLGLLPKPNQLFTIQELLRLISRSLSPGDAFRFAQCSRMCFHAAVGQIWYSVVGARHLFDLLSGILYVTEGLVTNVILPELSSSNLDRFDFYAPLVRRLEIFVKFSDRDAIFDCGSLITYAQHKTLLPNLKYLIFNSESSEEQLSWLTVFLSPSLLSIHDDIHCYDPVLDTESTLALVANLALRCPLLEDLNLYTSLENTPDRHTVLIPLLLPIYEYFGCMKNLRILRTNMPMFEPPALLALGKLPRLDTLEISETHRPVFSMEGVVLPGNLFPRLRKLCLPLLETEEFNAIWSIKQVVAGLTALQIEFDELDLENDSDALLNDIVQHSPEIVDLTVEYHSIIRISSDLFRPFKQLPLQKLSISGIDFRQADRLFALLFLSRKAGVLAYLRDLGILFGARYFGPKATKDFSHLSAIGGESNGSDGHRFWLSVWPELELISASGRSHTTGPVRGSEKGSREPNWPQEGVHAFT
ncbi:hypothetical protein BDV93DRAFT_579247 [Ceratobasidium sp. AG-I]|nr:hypothetical protein BDV93DRAFT_579247 [Ceratobasidium sp. AG-I]